MKKRIIKPIAILALSICIAIPTTFVSKNYVKAQASQTTVSYGGTIKTRDGDGVNVRASASIKGRRIGALSDGRHVSWDDYKNGWLHIVYPMNGWVSNRYVVRYNYNY